jgi:hypothetical protein
MNKKKYCPPKLKRIPIVMKKNPILRCGGGPLCNEPRK